MTAFRPAPADYLTLLRMGLVPVLWVLALLELPVHLGAGLAVAGLTDVLDGPVARWTGRSSRIGGQLDSVADILLMGSIFWWFVLLRPEFFIENAIPLVVWAVIGSAAVVVTLVKFGRFGNLHLYSAKAAGVVDYVFAVWVIVFGTYSQGFFVIAVGLAILASTETLLVALTRDSVSERIGTILTSRR
ncbi:MAG: CDP-alcohol phosphatidyltransferase family protein [Gemmatimonadota bacterium]